MANVFKLTDIAWEVKVTQDIEGLIRDSFGFHTQLLRTLDQEMFGQHMHVFSSLAQGRQAQTNDVQTVKQIFTEHAFFDALFQILVCGSNDANIGFNRCVPAHPVKMAIRQHAQQTCLKVKGHVANFIQKQSAAVSLLKATPS